MRHPLSWLFWLFILAIWVIGGAFIGRAFCCGIGATATSGLLIKDGATTVAATNAGNLLFGVNGAAPIIESTNVKTEFNDLATYLKDNPDKSVTLEGHYMASEDKSGTSFDNLGLARGDAMKGYLIGLGVPAAQLLTGSMVKENLEINDDNQIVGGMTYTFGTVAGGKNLNIQDAASFSTTAKGNLIFPMSSYEYIDPVTEEVTTSFQQTADYLKANPKRSIKITGLYTDQEKNSSVLPSLGMARANIIKSMLTGMGVPTKQIDIDARMENTLAFVNEETIGGATYAFFDGAESGDKLAEVEKRLRAKPIVLYFQTNSGTLTLSPEQRNQFADLIYYLDNKEGGRLNAVGHTDDRGAENVNRRLSRKRAEFVRDYISKNGGINQNLVSATGQGPDQPIADNGTDGGRAKNRRVEITIK